MIPIELVLFVTSFIIAVIGIWNIVIYDYDRFMVIVDLLKTSYRNSKENEYLVKNILILITDFVLVAIASSISITNAVKIFGN